MALPTTLWVPANQSCVNSASTQYQLVSTSIKLVVSSKLLTDMKQLIEYLQQLKTEVMFCILGICMKT